MAANESMNMPIKERKPVSPLLIILGLLSLCSIFVIALICGGLFWVMYNPGFLSTLTDPTEDIVQEISSDPNWVLRMEDEFVSNIYGWNMESSTEDTVRLKRTMENGKFIWDFRAKSEWSFWNWPNMEMFDDFVAAMELQHSDGPRADWYGIVFRISEGDFYCFMVDEYGSFGAWMFYQDEYKPLISGNRPFLIKPGEINRIAVKAIGSKFSFYINQKLVAYAEDNTLSLGHVGMILHPSGNPQNSTETTEPNGNSQSEPEWQQSRFEIEKLNIWVPKNSDQVRINDFLLLTPQPGRLVYMSYDDIYTIDTDGKNPTNLTRNPRKDYSPRWSPDGKQIVFVSERDGNAEIYMMHRDGSGVTRLTENQAWDVSPAWSPDGKKIVFSSNREGGNNLYILDTQTQSMERLTDGQHDIFPDWSPKGDLIIYQSERQGKLDIYVIDVKTKIEKRLTSGAPYSVARPVWSPDGLSYLYESVLSYKDQVGIAITEYPNMNFEKVIDPVGVNIWPTWSPDGAQIAFTSYLDGQRDIYIVSRDGKLLYRVTNDAAIEGMVDWTAE